MDIKEAKIMGGVGAILTVLGFVPKIGLILSIVGLILIYLALKKISEATAKSEIVSDFIKAIVLSILSGIIFLFSGGAALLGIISMIRGGFGLAIILFIIGWIVAIIGSYFYYQALNKTGESTNLNNFKTAGLLIFIGYILLIIVVGGIVVLIGKIFEIISFFSLPDKL
ncbi:MAG: DUF996 domain-containing protein [Caldisericia bacterium]